MFYWEAEGGGGEEGGDVKLVIGEFASGRSGVLGGGK